MATDPSAAATTTTATTAATNPPRLFPKPHHSHQPISPQLFHHHPQHPHPQPQHPPRLYAPQPLPARMPIPPYNNPQPPKPSHVHAHEGTSYPVASSGRGFVPHKALRPAAAAAADQTVTVANPGAAGFPPRSPGNFHAASHHAAQQHVAARPVQQYLPHHVAAVKGLPVSVPPKVVPSSSVPECNGYKDIREKSRDDLLAVVRDRKVRIIEGASLYALCRSWLRNGLPEENQPQFGDAVRTLPKPLPLAVATGNLKEEGEEKEDTDDGGEEDEESVEHLSAEDLFRGHVKRAKKVRARLREVRLKQIARYKLRLALLLPPLVEQFRNDTAAAGT